VGLFVLMIFMAFSSTSLSYAESVKKSALAGSPYDLVNAVHAFRASFGIAPYSINSILMSTAQAQADFLAATGGMTHSGPGGRGLTDRLRTPDDEWGASSCGELGRRWNGRPRDFGDYYPCICQHAKWRRECHP
jgi:uncharacterized protein YkwD